MTRAAAIGTGLAMLLALAASARADEPAKRGGPAPGVAANDEIETEVALTGNLARGLVDRTLLTGRASVAAASGPWGAFLQPSWVYGSVNGNRTDDERFVRGLGFHAITERTFAFAVGVYEHSLHRDIARRLFGGGGVGATLVHAPGASLLASAGLVDEVTRFAPDDARRTAVRATLRLYGRYTVGPIALTHDVYVMPSVTTQHDLRAIAYAALDVPLHAGLSARVAVDASYEQMIVAHTQHDDLAITFGLSYARSSR